MTPLALDQPKQQLWSVTWDCAVSIISDDRSTDREKAPAPHKVGTPSIFSPCNTSHETTCGPWSATNRDAGPTFYQGYLLIGRWAQ